MAALAVGPCAGFGPSRAELRFSPKGLPFPSGSVLLRSSDGGSRRRLLGSSRPFIPPARAVAVDSDQLGSGQPSDQERRRKYHFLVANAKFMLDEEEHFKELLFERLRLYGERNKEQDFWLVIEPKFLDQFPNITKRLRRPAVALVSADALWITFMKLRLDRVLGDNFEADSSIEEALASTPVDLKFEKPEKWVAPYPKYEPGWWEAFLPPGASKTSA